MFTNQDKVYELLPSQLNLYNLQMSNKKDSESNIGLGIRINDEIKFQCLEKVLQYIIEAKQVLRTRLLIVDNQIRQKYLSEVSVEVNYIEIEPNEEDPLGAAKDYMYKMNKCPMELLNKQLYEFTLIRVHTDCYYIFMKFHHIIVDGWSCVLLCREILQQYYFYEKHGKFRKEVSFKYSDYLNKWKKYSSSLSYQRDRTFWETKYETQSQVLIEPSKKDKENFVESSKIFSIDRSLYERIEKYCKEKKCSVVHFFLGILSIYFKKNYGKDDVIIGFPVFNRKSIKDKLTVGLFDNVLPVRLRNKTDDFDELVRDISEELFSCFRHCMYPFSLIEKYYKEKYNMNTRLFETVVSVMNSGTDEDGDLSKYSFEKVSNGHSGVALNLTIMDVDKNKDVNIDLEYNSYLFKDESCVSNFFSSIVKDMDELTRSK